uniref:Ig-like domain-containing protein n=1 Tax=Neogobius melanostomus TaxID=47308 RepID=A0A8C6TYM5_9GOBI
MVVLFICVCLILKLTLVAGQPGAVHYVLKGREATLPTGLPKAPDDILWKHNGDKVITFDSKEERVFPPYEGRVTLSWATAELTIADVRYEDSGEYELDAFIKNKLHRSQYMLKVLDKVSKPVIRCELNDESRNSTSVRGTLHCSSDSNTPEVLTFKWNLEGKSHLGQALNIALGDEHDHIEYSCTASNPTHAETNVFMAKDCHTAERTSKALDVIVPIIIASLILLAFCIFPFIFRHQIKRACFRRKKSDDLEKQRTVADKGSSSKGDIHRQETFASKQPLIQQNEEAFPQRQEIDKELKEVGSLGKVKGFKKSINREHTEPQQISFQGLTGLGIAKAVWPRNDTDSVETATSRPASPIRNGQVDSEGQTDRDTDFDLTETQALLSKPDEHASKGQTDSTGVPDAHHSEHEDVQKSDEAGDSSSIHSGQEEDNKAPEQADTLFQAHLQTGAPPVDALQFINKELAECSEESEPIEPEREEQVSPAEDSPPAPEDKDPHDNLEKQITVADKGKDSPLKGDIHRQEPLNQQNEGGFIQRQEIDKELKEVELLEKVKKRVEKFQNQEGNDTDCVETATSRPASPIRNGQVDSKGETDNNAPKTEGDRDTNSDHSSYGFEQTKTQALLPNPDDHESKGQTDSTGVPDAHHSDHEDVQRSVVTGDSSSIHSGQEEEDTKAPEQAELAESNGKSEPNEPEGKEQPSPDKHSPQLQRIH